MKNLFIGGNSFGIEDYQALKEVAEEKNIFLFYENETPSSGADLEKIQGHLRDGKRKTDQWRSILALEG